MARQNIPDEKVLEKYNSLPEDLRAALFSSAVTNNILEIGKNAGLSIDKIGELADETGLVMLGITSPSEYIKNLAHRLGVETEKVKAIAEEINQKVFQPVRESLKKIHGLGGEVIKPPLPKPLPRREDIVKPPPEPKKPLEIKQVLPPTPPPRPTPQQPTIPTIFVKKFPPPAGGPDLPPKADIVPPKKEPPPGSQEAAKSALEKELNAPVIQPRPQYQQQDPYKEPTA